MHSLHSWSLSLLILAAGAFPAATAQTCTPPYGEYGYHYFIDNQTTLDDLATRCTTINGSIVISPNYTGRFYLPAVQNITEMFRWALNINTNDPEKQRPSPTIIDLPDLEYLGESLWLNGLSSVTNVSMPRLKTVEADVKVDYARQVDFGALEDVDYLAVVGGVESLRLGSLREVHQRLQICNKDQCGTNVEPSGSLDISLPSLQSVGTLSLKGRISSLEVSSLTTVAGDGVDVYDFEFSTAGGPTLNLTFPRLDNFTGEMSLDGDIGSLSMPNLRNMSQSGFSLSTYDDLAVDLPFDGIHDLTLGGSIASIDLPNLHFLNSSISVSSTLPIDCASILDTLSTATNTTVQAGGKLQCTTTSTFVTYSKGKGHSGLSTGAKAAIGVVVGVVGAGAIAGVVVFFWLKKRKGEGEKLKMVDSDADLPGQEATMPTAYTGLLERQKRTIEQELDVELESIKQLEKDGEEDRETDDEIDGDEDEEM
ncbi:hypothetical protein BJX76DRAFT_355517 [Aspergillus varians]